MKHKNLAEKWLKGTYMEGAIVLDTKNIIKHKNEIKKGTIIISWFNEKYKININSDDNCIGFKEKMWFFNTNQEVFSYDLKLKAKRGW